MEGNWLRELHFNERGGANQDGEVSINGLQTNKLTENLNFSKHSNSIRPPSPSKGRKVKNLKFKKKKKKRNGNKTFVKTCKVPTFENKIFDFKLDKKKEARKGTKERRFRGKKDFATIFNDDQLSLGKLGQGKKRGREREDVERATIEWVSHLCRPTRPVRGQIDGPAIVKLRMRLRPLD